MKKLLFLLFAGLTLPFSVAFGQDQTYSLEQPKKFYNLWGLKSYGFFVNFGGEKFFEPLTFDYFNRNSGYKFSQYLMPPPGNGLASVNPLDQVVGFGLELAWPVGKKQNEIRTSLSVQQHSYPFNYNTHYNISPDTVRLLAVSIYDNNLLSQASLDYVFYSKPILKHFRFLWRTGSTFGYSIPTNNKFNRSERFRDIPIAYVFANPDGSLDSYMNNYELIQYPKIESNSRLEAGLRTSVGLELMLDIFWRKIGLSAEYGHGLAGQKVLKGGTTDFKRTEFKQVQLRYFLR